MKKRIIDRDVLRSPGTRPSIVDSGRTGLPPEMLAASAERLAMVALVYSSVYLLTYVAASAFVGPESEHDAPFTALTALFVAPSLAVAALARREWLPLEKLPDIGLLYMVFAALGIEIGLLWVPRDTPFEMLGLSWTVVWLAIFPLIVPVTPGKMLLAAIAAASMRPLMILILVARGYPSPPVGSLVLVLVPQAIAVGLAMLGTRIIYGLGRDVSRARQLGSYELLEPLGKGGMGEVWRAQHGMLARPAAIKLVRPESLGQAEPAARTELLKRFEREARATAALTSPHTVHVHDFGITNDSTFYYAMELLQGLDAEQLVERFGPLPPARAVAILIQVCDSLAEAHAAGLVHRDVKPANIFLCRRGLVHDFVKVLDFGLVKALGGYGRNETAITAQHVATGTPAFMAPEVALAENQVDGRTDLYSVGCLAYWLLTGRFVFDTGGAVQIMMAHATAPPERPSRRTEQPLPEALEDVIMACLAKDPAARPATADALRRQLASLQFDAPWDRDAAARWWQAHLPELA